MEQLQSSDNFIDTQKFGIRQAAKREPYETVIYEARLKDSRVKNQPNQLHNVLDLLFMLVWILGMLVSPQSSLR